MVGKKVATTLFMRLGGVVGRLVPYAGWAITAYDMYDKRGVIGEFISDMQKENESHANDLMWHVHKRYKCNFIK